MTAGRRTLPAAINQGVTTSSGRLLAASSLEKMTCGSAMVVERSTSVISVRPAASSALTRFVRSHSYHLPVVPEIVVLGDVAVVALGRLFQVRAASLHVVFVEVETVTFTPPDIAWLSRPNSRSFADDEDVKLARSNRSHVSRL